MSNAESSPLNMPDQGIDPVLPVIDVDGEAELDPDADEDSIDSAEADRLAAEGGGTTSPD